jgi:hypothetical protein
LVSSNFSFPPKIIFVFYLFYYFFIIIT